MGNVQKHCPRGPREESLVEREVTGGARLIAPQAFQPSDAGHCVRLEGHYSAARLSDARNAANFRIESN